MSTGWHRISPRLDGNRRGFLVRSALGAAGALALPHWLRGAEQVTLPFENGTRTLVAYPQKRPLIRLTTRPPQLETPFEVFNEGLITPNDAFFVRYHLSESPPLEVDSETFRLVVQGAVRASLSLSIRELRERFEAVEVTAVNQCSGNSRGFSKPRVPGGQMGHGAMGNAVWRGVRLRDVLELAGVAAGSRQVVFNGLDRSHAPGVPDFVKSLDIDHARDGEVMLAYAMNGADLPMLNGYPLRLVVPGYFGTYWIKHVNEITVLDGVFNGYWMNPAYRIPDTAGGCVDPGTTPKSTVPITRFSIRSFITSHRDGAILRRRETVPLRGIAFDGGHGITEVLVSADGGRSWRPAELGKDHGRYSFREWTLPHTPSEPGDLELRCRAFNRVGQTQPLEPLWNPAGYMRNVVERVNVRVA